MSPGAAAGKLGTTPAVGEKAPTTTKLSLPSSKGNPTVVTFLRHCGCPCMLQVTKSTPYAQLIRRSR